MRNPMRLASLAIVLLSTPALAQEPLRGDVERGAQLYRMECAACHGADGRGSAFWPRVAVGKPFGPIPDLQDSSFMATLSDAQLVNAMRLGKGANGPLLAHDMRSLSKLDAWDLVAFLRRDHLRVQDFFPQAVKFTAHEFTIDDHGVKRLKENLKLTLDDAQRKVVLLTAYSGERKGKAPARLVPWTPVELDLLDRKARVGHLVFLDVVPPGEKKPVTAGFAFDLDGKLARVRVRHPDAKLRSEYEKLLSAYVGQGEKKATAFKPARGVRGADRWVAVVTAAAARAAEAVVMFDKAERERTVFDR